MTIDDAIREHGALKVYLACDGGPGCPERMVALGLPEPQTMDDVFQAMKAAYAAMTPQEQAEEDRHDDVRGRYLASASKAGVGAPRMPRGRDR